MRTIFLVSWIFLFLTLPVFAGWAIEETVLDLTHDFSDETVYWPTSRSFQLEGVHQGKTGKGYYYAANNFCAAEHGGTHLDAPIHFAEGAQTADEIPLEDLIGEAIVIDATLKASQDRDYQITIDDVEAWEAVHGAVNEGAIVLLRTGLGVHWPDPQKYLGTSLRGEEGVKGLHFPGLGPEAAEWLVNGRKIKAVGIDTASIDFGQSNDFRTHRILAQNNIPIFENLSNLDKLPAKGARIFALPMKIRGGSGAPLRAIAFLPKEES